MLAESLLGLPITLHPQQEQSSRVAFMPTEPVSLGDIILRCDEPETVIEIFFSCA